MKRDPDIYCPQCGYLPQPEDRWECVPSCGAVWNTFWTHGICPGCSHHWQETQCPFCGELSPHEDWYHYPEDQPQGEEKQSSEESTVGA